MPRPWQFLIFISLLATVTGGLHYYAWVRLVRDSGLSGTERTVATATLVGLFVMMLSSLPISRLAPRAIAAPVAWAGYIWMGTLAVLFFVMVTGDGLRFLLRLFGSGGAGRLAGPLAGPLSRADPDRRALLGRVFALATLGVTGALSGLSLWTALRRVGVREVRIRLPRLPKELSGLRLVQITDLHIGPTIRRPWLEQVVAQVNALSADIVVITGDLVDGTVAELSWHTAPLGALRARHGVFFVTGNHEYYSGVDAWIEELRRLGVRVLRNERVPIQAGPTPAHTLDLAGVDDYHSGRFPGHGPDLPRALLGRDPARPVVLLAHQPAAIDEAATHGVDLQLSGHTHGGQLWPWRFMVRLQQPYVSGLHQHGPTQIYVSNGTGYWGPPMRLWVPAEITHITLLSS
jgi:predicted MPP superfamily phosphohydrolase